MSRQAVTDDGVRARVAGRVDIAARIVWKLEVGAFRVRCIREVDGSTLIVQAHDGAGWNKEVTRGTDAYQLFQAVVASKGVLSVFKTFVKGTTPTDSTAGGGAPS